MPLLSLFSGSIQIWDTPAPAFGTAVATFSISHLFGKLDVAQRWERLASSRALVRARRLPHGKPVLAVDHHFDLWLETPCASHPAVAESSI